MRTCSVSATGDGNVIVRSNWRRFILTRPGPLSLIIAPLMVSPSLCFALGQSVESLYSPLTGPQCKSVMQNHETGAAKDECVGVGGFRLFVLNDDSRASVTVVTPEGKEFPLAYWDVVTHAFSNLGAKAEWRVVHNGSKVQPKALIVRVEYSDQSNVAAPKKKSVLSVAKISPDVICVVKVVSGGADANVRARAFADKAETKACLGPQP